MDNQKAQALIKGRNHKVHLKLSYAEYPRISRVKKMNFILVLDGVTDVSNI